jgi:hypothetical protein
MADAPPANPNAIDELAVDFTRDTMPIVANNLTRRQLFQMLPRSMSQYELAFVKNAIREADRDTKMDPVFERNKVFGLQLNGQPYPEVAAAPAQAPAPTFTLGGFRYCTTDGGGYICIELQPPGTPDSQVAEVALGGGQVRRLVHTSTGRVYEIPNEPNEAPIRGHFQTTLDAQLAAAAAAAQENVRTNSNPRNRNDDGPFIPPNPAQVELLRRVAARPPVSSNIATKVMREVRALKRQTRDPRLALSTLKDNFRGFLARTRGDKAVVAHEYVHQFMVEFQYVVPREDLEDLKTTVLDVKGCQGTLFRAGWMAF